MSSSRNGHEPVININTASPVVGGSTFCCTTAHAAQSRLAGVPVNCLLQGLTSADVWSMKPISENDGYSTQHADPFKSPTCLPSRIDLPEARAPCGPAGFSTVESRGTSYFVRGVFCGVLGHKVATAAILCLTMQG